MNGMSAQDFAAMENNGTQVRERRLWLGMTIEQLASEADVSPDTLSDYEAGVRIPRRLTVSKVLAALDRIESEVGKDAPPAAKAPGDPGGLVEFDISGDFGVHVVVKGPVGDADALKAQVVDIIREIRKSDPKGDTPE